MTKTEEKQINQIKEWLGINEEQQKADFEQYATLLKEQMDSLDEEDRIIAESQLLSNKYIVDYEQENPVSKFIHTTLLANMDKKDVSKCLNFITSDTFKQFCSVVDAALEQNMNRTLDYIDKIVGIDTKTPTH